MRLQVFQATLCSSIRFATGIRLVDATHGHLEANGFDEGTLADGLVIAVGQFIFLMTGWCPSVGFNIYSIQI